MGNAVCIECGKPAKCFHHIVPKVLGGTRTLPLCYRCHSKVHGHKSINISSLVKAGIEKARRAGKKIGGSVSKYDRTIVERIKQLYAQCSSPMHISRILSIPESTIRDILKREREREDPKEN